MQCSQSQNIAFREMEIIDQNLHKKRKLLITDDERENRHQVDNNNWIHSSERKFLFISKKDCTSVFQTEEWQSSGSVLFLPLNEDILVNTQNIEQFSCGQEGNFFVADQNGQYSKTITGNVLHFWRYCTGKNKLFIARSILFKNPQDFFEIQQALLKL